MNKMELVHTIKGHVPRAVLEAYHSAKRYCVWKLQQRVYYKAVDTIRMKKEPLRVLFIVNDSAMWKYDSLYRLMREDPEFLPQILVCPTITYITKLEAQEKLQSTFDVFSNRGYSVIKATEDVSLNGVSVASLRPDIVFYSYLWTSSIETQYDVHALRDYLKCYVNYGFSNTAGEWGYASAFQGLMWRYFAECEDVRSIALKAQPREMRNIVVTGYPIYDEYEAAKSETSIWKSSDTKFKHVIWAPHHTIEGHDGILKLSTFLENAERMFTIAEKYKNIIQFVFKPHPLLKAVLYHHPRWGKEKTDEYYHHLEVPVRNHCVVPWCQANVNYNGDVTFCADYVEYPLGNIKEQSFREIYNGERANKFRHAMVECPGEIFPGCIRCYQNMLFGKKIKGY